MKKLQLRTKTIDWPDCWEDLTEVELMFVMQQLTNIRSRKILPQKARILILKKLTGYRPSIVHINWPWRPKFTKADKEHVQLNLTRLSELITFPFSIEEKTNRVIFNYTMRRNPLPAIDGVIGKKFTIGDVMVKTNITAQEFCDAFDAYKMIGLNEAGNDCIQIILSILHPHAETSKFSNLQIFTILFWFQSICEWFFHHPVYSILFRQAADDEPLAENRYAVGMDEIIMQLSRSGYDSLTNLQSMTVIDFFDLQVASLRTNVREAIAKGAKKEDLVNDMHLSINQINDLLV